MTQTERLDYILKYLIDELEYPNNKMQIPSSYKEKRFLMKSLLNIRPPKEISDEFIKVQDDFLKNEAEEKGIIDVYSLPAKDKISVWQGDITRLKVGAIVNAANSEMLGCFQAGHMCIDNVIHTASGVQLREECFALMQEKRRKFNDPNYVEPTGKAMITKGYNLPAEYVIHTVGPIVYGNLTESLKDDLANCYKSVLSCCIENKIKTVAFCCISTGVFCFPNEEAGKIAVKTVKEFLKKDSFIERVVFNVFKDLDLEIYNSLV